MSMTRRDTSGHGLAELANGRGQGDVDYWRGIKRSECPHKNPDDAAAAARWFKMWDQAAESASDTLRESATIIRRAGPIRDALMAAARYLRDTQGSKEARARSILVRELRQKLEIELTFLPLSATGDHRART